MIFGEVRNLKIECRVSAFGVEGFLFTLDNDSHKLGEQALIYMDDTLGHAIIEFAETREKSSASIFQIMENATWTLSPTAGNLVLCQLTIDPIEMQDGTEADDFEERLEFEFTCSLKTLVDSYRWMLSQILQEHGQEFYLDKFNCENAPSDQLEKLNQISQSLR